MTPPLKSPSEIVLADGAILPATAFEPYVQHLASLLDMTARYGASARRAEVASALDGQPGRQLRKLYSATELRGTGTYFTGSKLANRLVFSLARMLPNVSQIVDPACGAGDLLVACARHLPIQRSARETMRAWGARLFGFDINSAFVGATRCRLALLAMERTQAAAPMRRELSLRETFGNIEARSGLTDWRLQRSPAVIVVNPPFSYGVAKQDCEWASGRVSQAASFMDVCLRNATTGTRILAILPDVLRTGTRYEKWRKMVAQKARVNKVQIAGQFDELTEINVFLMDLVVGETNDEKDVAWAHPTIRGILTVKDLFSVHVGPVVPFRLDGTGRWCGYFQAEQLPPWQTVDRIQRRIRFKGTTYKPPFVTIRRTSKADYQVRCIGTVVTGSDPIAVENHLLVAIPHDKTISTCQKLLRVLQRESTSRWMNERIRCRHLTVGSVSDVPWPEDET
jgi:N-6 DNA Methylase